MKYYFKFSNIENKVEHCIYDSLQENVYNTNLNYIELKIYLSDINTIHKQITNYKFIIEREVNGIYVNESVIEGVKFNDIVKFEKCELNKEQILSSNTTSNIKYKCYLECYEGGILVYTDVKQPVNILFKNTCENFTLDIENSLLINGVYELQDEEVKQINFTINVLENYKSTLRYYYKFGKEENIEPKQFLTLEKNLKRVTYDVVTPIFENETTYLHFFLKDSFNNIRYKKFKLITKSGTNELFEIVDYIQNINDENTQLSFFYNSKNITKVTPKIQITDNENTYEEISKRQIGLTNNNRNYITITLKEYFPNIMEKFKENSEIYISFKINDSEKCCTPVTMNYDNEVPKIICNDLIDDYALVLENKENYELTGQIYDKNLFYIGRKKEYDFKNIKNHILIISDQDIDYVKENGENKKIIKYGNYYVANMNSNNYQLYDQNNQLVTNYKVIDDFNESGNKSFFIALDVNELNTYEKNLIENNEIQIKEIGTNHIIKQEKMILENYILFKVYVEENNSEMLKIDLGIDGTEYSLLKYIKRKHVSCVMDYEKKVNLNFLQSKILFINLSENIEAYIYDANRKNNILNSILLSDFSILAVSLKNDEFFSSDKEIYFTDNELNLKPIKEIYFKPKLKVNNIPSEITNYSLEMVNDKFYNFKMLIPILENLNKYTIEFSDTLNNKIEKQIEIEKQTKEIKIKFDEIYSEDVIFKKNAEKYNLFLKKEATTIKLLIENETKLDKKNNSYILFDKNKNMKYKIIREENIAYSIVDLYNLNGTQHFEIYYSDNNKPIIDFDISVVEEMEIKTNSNIITGNDVYYLKLYANSFATINYSTTNKNFHISVLKQNEAQNEKIIKIQRVSNYNLIEKLDLIITAYDIKGIYSQVNKTVSMVFYTDNIISKYWIEEELLNEENEIIKPSFDLHLKTFQQDYIKDIYIYDNLELEFMKRKKKAIYNEKTNEYIIKNIVTPIVYSDFEINIELKNDEDIKIKKILFENNPIRLSENFYNLSATYFSEQNKLIGKIKNNLQTTEKFKQIEVYANFKPIFSQSDLTIKENEEISLEIKENNIMGKVILKTKLTTDDDQIIYLNPCNLIISPSLNKSENKILNLKSTNVLQKGQYLDVILSQNNEEENILYIVDPFKNKVKKELKKGINKFNLNHNGMYILKHFIKNLGIENIIDIFYVYVSESYEKDIKLKNKSFEKYNFIKEMIIFNPTNFDLDVIEPKIEFYLSGKKEKEYTYNKRINHDIYFVVDKSDGESEYYYKDNFIRKKIAGINVINATEKIFDFYDITTKNESGYFIKDNTIYLENKSNLYFKTKGITDIDVLSYDANRVFEKIILDEQENVILSGFIPCEIKCFDKNKNIIYQYKIENLTEVVND